MFELFELRQNWGWGRPGQQIQSVDNLRKRNQTWKIATFTKDCYIHQRWHLYNDNHHHPQLSWYFQPVSPRKICSPFFPCDGPIPLQEVGVANCNLEKNHRLTLFFTLPGSSASLKCTKSPKLLLVLPCQVNLSNTSSPSSISLIDRTSILPRARQ